MPAASAVHFTFSIFQVDEQASRDSHLKFVGVKDSRLEVDRFHNTFNSRLDLAIQMFSELSMHANHYSLCLSILGSEGQSDPFHDPTPT